jgi:hypothetical protein
MSLFAILGQNLHEKHFFRAIWVATAPLPPPKYGPAYRVKHYIERASLFVSSDSGHIVDGQAKLILGLIWTLILHYSISMPMWEEDEFDEPISKAKTPKQRLLAWVQNKVPDKPINNFTGDWTDGRAIGALVDAIAPGENKILKIFKQIDILLYRPVVLEIFLFGFSPVDVKQS